MKRIMAVAALFFALAANPAFARKYENTKADDYYQILELSSRYAWGMDTLDKELLSTVFSSDAHAHYKIVNDSPIQLDKKIQGLDAIFEFLQSSFSNRKGFELLPWHFVSSHIVEIDGDNASLRFYMHNRPGTAGGVYYMQVARTPQGWRVKDLRLDEQQMWNVGAYVNDKAARSMENETKE